jgi:hypothetical protein
MGVVEVSRLDGSAIRGWRGRHWPQAEAALWFDRSVDWVHSVELGRRRWRSPTLHSQILAVFTRFYALEAFARGIQAEVDPNASGPKARIALNRAIEALRAAGMQASDVDRLSAQPYDKQAR